MIQRPDDTGTETVQLLHGLWPQTEGQVGVQTVVPEKPTNPAQAEGSERQRGAEERYGETDNERNLNTRLIREATGNSESCEGAVRHLLTAFTPIRQVLSAHIPSCNSPITPWRQFAQRGQAAFQLQDAQRPADPCEDSHSLSLLLTRRPLPEQSEHLDSGVIL